MLTLGNWRIVALEGRKITNNEAKWDLPGDVFFSSSSPAGVQCFR